MARYIKVNYKVAQFLNLQNDRVHLKDGNYILWQADMLAFGPLTSLPATLSAIGAIALLPSEARQEQDGSILRPLPAATDPHFIIPVPVPEESETPTEATDSEEPDAPAESEKPAEQTEADNAAETTPTNKQSSKKASV